MDCNNVCFFIIILYNCLTLPLVNQRVKKHLTVLLLITPRELVIILIKYLHKVEMQTIMAIATVEYNVGNKTLTGPKSCFKIFSSISIFNLLNYFAPFYKPKVCKYKVMQCGKEIFIGYSKKMMSSHQHNAD